MQVYRHHACIVYQLTVFFFPVIGMSLTFISSIGVIPHYFKRRKDAAYTGVGLGVGIAFTASPYKTESVFASFGYKYGILCLLHCSGSNLYPPAASGETGIVPPTFITLCQNDKAFCDSVLFA